VRCHFRHEYRTFKKIHRHYYIVHLAALNLTYEDILSDSRGAPDGSNQVEKQKGYTLETASSDESFEGSSKDQNQSTDDEASVDDEVETGFAPIIPGHIRLPIFQIMGQQSPRTKKSEETVVAKSVEP